VGPTCQQLLPHVDQQRQAHAQQAVHAPPWVSQQRIPNAHSIGEGELLREQQRDPAECEELRVNLQWQQQLQQQQ
jgi:hypothetical protein